MSVGKQAHDQPVDKVLLSDNDRGDFRPQRVDKHAVLPDLFVDGGNSCAHMVLLEIFFFQIIWLP